ncbi:MAG: hypothetical protein GKS06_12485 [Acidobacteria bacterium]|nr:hypothetical protein [Acidobacteriota bacterium]
MIAFSEEEASSTSACAGAGGYRLLVHDGDARQSITIVRPDGTEWPLDYWSTVTQGFSAVGWEAEWRVSGRGGDAVPTALIVPVNASEWSDDQDEVPVSYLAIAKITADTACVTDVLTPALHQSDRARRLADSAAQRQCLDGFSERDDDVPTGRYCYAHSTPTVTSNLLLSVDAAGSFRGRAESAVHDEANSYFTSYAQRIEGRFGATLSGSHAGTADITTWIEYDVQRVQEHWLLTPDGLDADGSQYERVACDPDFPVAYPEEVLGIEETPTDTREADVGEGSSVVLANSVVRGFRDRWVIDMPGGLVARLHITSLEDNAVFDVIDPSGLVLVTEGVEQELLLPHNGRYEIVVGGIRGNASYELRVTLE